MKDPTLTERTTARLNQLAGMCGHFYEQLLEQRFPADVAAALVGVWLEKELEWEDEDE